ncbi:MAG: VWA domain-containing protein [Hydrotalea flava]|uniref:vWA domain-containing protein n=1 Tax=Hydrotalea TaxID=1004300 RepID=UPI0016B73379|nr:MULTISPECIES: VWA domain-containing protein [Hydrotalea]MBY0347536.1 VWA domain-containing protein [Hydrotalea flava]NIM34688.1 VWA domain-containing protein [Hydrotalea flava]NIM37524.1 VWA domain-containing protein [Hydrotalea flava]NIN02684.1 VWA domain-containing protein [Hydrotalea flava]NIN14369.1 VWA domain-containing protein [Hydrotalea flava]
MQGHRFIGFNPSENQQSIFEQLLNIFMQLLTYTNGDAAEALQWMNELDKQYQLTNPEYGMGDFIEELKQNGYLEENTVTGSFKITSKSEQTIRKKSLEEIFGKLKKSKSGNHTTFKPGQGDEINPETRPFQFGDMLEQIDFTQSIRNAQINHGIESFSMYEDDLQIRETDFKTQTSTVLMIDISHSMILYGEDRITPAKKVAMALSELITTKYPKDTLDIVVFGNDAWTVEIKDLPYLQVGPYHTNTVAGLELAMDLLRRRKNPNKQIFMITDGKPTCLKVGKKYYKNSFGIDRKILNRCINLAAQCKKLKIPITTFMIASDPYLQKFVQEFTEMNQGKAFFAGLDKLGAFIFKDFESGKNKTLY